MIIRRSTLLLLAVLLVAVGCRKYRDDLELHTVQQTWSLEELSFGEIVQFESVFWEPDDTVSLRKLIVDDSIASGRDVLEIGTGTGVIAILCLQNNAKRVVATDINPIAADNAKYNAAVLVPDQTLEVRRVSTDSPGAFSVIPETERYDLIISNPPWEDGTISKPADHAFYDPGFELMDSLLDGLPKHLRRNGRCLLAYGHRPAIERLKVAAEERNLEFKILDDRSIESLETDFLPGMLIEIRLPLSASKVAGGTINQADSSEGGVGDVEAGSKQSNEPVLIDIEGDEPEGSDSSE